MANDYSNLFRTLTQSFNELGRKPDNKNALIGMVRQDITPAFGEMFGTVSTNIVNSSGTPTNLASGSRLTLSDVNFDPMNVTLDQHPSYGFSLPAIDQSKGVDDPAIRTLRDEAVKKIGDAINTYLVGLITTGNFTNTPVDTTADADIPDTAMASAWETLANLGVPVGDLGDMFLITRPTVYKSLLLNDSWTRHSDIGDIASGIRVTALLGTQWGAFVDFDPNMTAPASGVYTSLYFHRNAIALVARAVKPPLSDGPQCTYVYYRGIPIRVVVDYDPTLLADVMTFDVLFGAAVVRPTWGIILKNTP
jgi:hypothetical protein